uniref:fluoride efflux transporter FluC n=1 Tax=Lentilactobacillus buchneri TaxID=1581 RepID=UPI003F54BE9D
MKNNGWYRLGQVSSVFCGGALGGISRYEIGNWIHSANGLLGTSVVNLLGCFLLTFTIYGLDLRFDLPEWQILGLGTGFVGAFTTFSTFTLQFVQGISNNPLGSLIFLLVNLIGGMLCVPLGYLAATRVGRRQR